MKTIVFSGGGTAGHIMPNLVLIKYLKQEFNCVYVGTHGMECDMCAQRGIEFFTLPQTVKLARDKLFSNALVPFKFASSVKKAKPMLAEINPDLIFSKGGYASLPVVFGARKDVPVIIHESDFSLGIANKLSARRAEHVLCAFSETAKKIKKGEFCGIPLDVAPIQKKKKFFPDDKPVLLIVGGSSGSLALNACVESAKTELLKTFNILHITGKNKSADTLSRGAEGGYIAIEFSNDMPALYSAADACITRGGATTLAELAAYKIPSLAVPLEKASRGDQLLNARYYEKHGALKILRECDMTAATLSTAAKSLIEPHTSAAIKNAAQKLSINGTDKIIRIIKETVR